MAGVVLTLAVGAAGCGRGNVKVELIGGLQAGLFLTGSTITVSAVDGAGNPTGQVFTTTTTNDAGDFALPISRQGRISIEGSGLFWNQVRNGEPFVSEVPLTLRAFGEVSTQPQQPAYVNLVTHLTYGRIKALLAAPHPPTTAQAIAQAERELRQGLGIGGAGFDPRAAGMQMSMTGGDSDANAYVFAVGTIFARMDFDIPSLQQHIDQVASSFAVDGRIDPDLVMTIQNTQVDYPASVYMGQLAQRLKDIGSTATVPDLDRVWDNDMDGVRNAADNCPWTANPDQAPINALCRVTVLAQPEPIFTVGDLTDDGKPDLVVRSADLQDLEVRPNDGTAHFLAPISTPQAVLGALVFDPGRAGATAPGDETIVGGTPTMWVGDVDKDGHNDLVAGGQIGSDSATMFFPGDGSGHFGRGIPFLTQPIDEPVCNYTQCQASTGRMLYQVVVADFDGDGLNDIVGAAAGVWLAWGTSPRSWAPPIRLTSYDHAGPVVGDVNRDGRPDIVTPSVVFLSKGSQADPFATVPIYNSATTLADIDRDGILDLVVGGEVIRGDGTGHFPAVLYGSQSVLRDVHAADFTGDGWDDLLLDGNTIYVENQGQLQRTGIDSQWMPVYTLDDDTAVADLNGDGIADLVPLNSQVVVLINPK